jgi:hypothetical protein
LSDLFRAVLSGLAVFLLLIIPRAVVGLTPDPVRILESSPLLWADTTDRLPGILGDSTRRARALLPPRVADSLARIDSLTTARVDSLKRDSLATARKRSIVSDTTYVICKDSSARLRQMVIPRSDPKVVEFFPDRPYPLFPATRSSGFRRAVTFDSTGSTVMFAEKVFGENLRTPLSLSFHDYLLQRRGAEFRKALADEARRPRANLQKNDLGDLFSSITKIISRFPPTRSSASSGRTISS